MTFSTASSLPRGASVPFGAIQKILLISFLASVVVFLQPYFLSSESDHSIYFGVQFFAILFFMGLTFIFIEKVLIHPYVFLLGTLGLFIGGRFIALLAIDQPVFSDNNYIPIALSSVEAIQLMSKISGGLLMMHVGLLGVLLFKANGRLGTPHDGPSEALVLPCLLLLLISAAVSVFAITRHYIACSEFGYLAIYQDQKIDNLLRFASMGQYGLLLGAGLAFTTSRKWLHVLAMALVAGYFLAYLGVGLRSGFLSLVLMGVWLIHTRMKKLNFLVLMLVPIVMIALAQLAITVGCRAQPVSATESALAINPVAQPESKANSVVDSPSIAEAIGSVPGSTRNRAQDSPKYNYVSDFGQRLRLNELGWFTYLQGSTLVYTGAAFRLEHYPVHAYFQTFIPGYSQLASRLDKAATPADFYFPHYLAKTYSDEKYNSGFGMGWSMFADFQALSFGNGIGYAIVTLLFGLALGYFFVATESSAFFFGALVCVFLKITLLPRSGLYSVMPYLVVFGVLYGMAIIIYRYAPPRLKSLISLRP